MPTKEHHIEHYYESSVRTHSGKLMYKLYVNLVLAYKKLVTLATKLMLEQSVPIKVNT